MTNSSFSGRSEEASPPKLKLVTKSIETSHGKVSAVYALPVGTAPTICLFIAHGVKGSMNSSLVSYFHSGLAARGFLTVKFNFPYAEGRLRFVRKADRTEVLVDCYERVVEVTRKSEWKPKHLFLGGASMGAAIASHVVADRARIPELRGLFFLNYPFHRPATPEIIGDAHFSKIFAPMIFVAGTRDIYAQPKAVKTALSRLGAMARIHWVEAADRGFNKHKGKAVYSKTLEEITQTLVEWINSYT